MYTLHKIHVLNINKRSIYYFFSIFELFNLERAIGILFYAFDLKPTSKLCLNHRKIYNAIQDIFEDLSIKK